MNIIKSHEIITREASRVIKVELADDHTATITLDGVPVCRLEALNNLGNFKLFSMAVHGGGSLASKIGHHIRNKRNRRLREAGELSEEAGELSEEAEAEGTEDGR